MGLTKEDGGVRPIAVGCTLRRLAAKCSSMMMKDEMGLWLSSIQLDLGTSHCAEAAVHGARIYLSSIDEGHMLLKLDYSNALNSVCRC